MFGNSNGLAVVDYIQKTVVLNLGTVELYGSNDPYQRQPRSPRKTRQASGGEKKKKSIKTIITISEINWAPANGWTGETSCNGAVGQ